MRNMEMQTWQPPQPVQPKQKRNFTTIILVIAIIASLLGGGLIGYAATLFVNSGNGGNLQSQITSLQQQITGLQSLLNAASTNSSVTFDANSSLAQIYAQVKDSVVVVQGYTVQYDFFGRAFYSGVQGSGFVYNYNGKMIIITNNHVTEGTVNDTVTFANGNSYTATVLGADPYADLAALSANAPAVEYKPLQIASSSLLNVGDLLIAVGGPYGLAGSMTTGIVSALGRTITDDSSSYPIANVIQTSTPINPGNSGGPLLNYEGQVVGITTAIVSESQGLGFAIPSTTILREIGSLVTDGSYNQHPWIGASGTDMTLEIANALNVNVTYGWLVAGVTSNGPADKAEIEGGSRQINVAGKQVTVGGDIIIAFGGTRIRNTDDLSTYLEENTLPGETINVTLIRDGQTMTLALKLEARPTTA
jgi:S1-C subfamily serine protease